MSQSFSIEIPVSNKPQSRDPEDETIIRDLVHKTGFESVKEVRTGKLLTIRADTANQEDTKDKVLLMCNELTLQSSGAFSQYKRKR